MHLRGFLKGLKNAYSVHLSFVFMLAHAGTGGIGCSYRMIETTEQCRAIPIQKCAFLKAVLVALSRLSFRKTNIFNLYLRVQAKIKQFAI